MKGTIFARVVTDEATPTSDPDLGLKEICTKFRPISSRLKAIIYYLEWSCVVIKMKKYLIPLKKLSVAYFKGVKK